MATIAQQLERERAEGTPGSAIVPVAQAPNLLSDTEAQSIWRRAADLQSLTGIQPRPTPILGERDAERDAARTSGYRVADIRGAASEAGIDPKYVDHALAEHGVVMPNVVTLPPLIAVDRGSDDSVLSGGRHQLQYEVVVDGEVPEDDFDLLVDIIRRETNQTGLLASVGRSLSWQTHPGGRSMQVSVLPRGGKTTIRVSENLKKAMGEIFGGLMGGIGGVMAPIMLGVGFKLHNPLFAASVWAGSFLITYATSRGFFWQTTRSRDKELRSLTEALAEQARESIAQARPKLPR